jgi:hypothetical protein
VPALLRVAACSPLWAAAITLQAVACAPPAPSVATAEQPLVDWNGIDWNGIDWNGIDWNGIDWNGIDWNGIDWNGIDWNGIDWNGVELLGLWGDHGAHPDARPLFVFMRARAGADEFPLAVPSPPAQHLIDTSPDPGAAVYFLEKSWQIAYGPGFRFYAGRHDLDGDGEPEPIVAEGRYGLAPSLAGLGPYSEPQVAAWSSVIGNLLNTQPFQLSLRAYDVDTMAADPAEVARYRNTDLRGAIGRLIPPPGALDQRPFVVLFRDRMGQVTMGPGGEMIDQLDQRRACPLGSASWVRCGGGDVTVVSLGAAQREGFGGCDPPAGIGPWDGAVSGRCWISLPHVAYAQDAAIAPITASLVDMRQVCPTCPVPPMPTLP